MSKNDNQEPVKKQEARQAVLGVFSSYTLGGFTWPTCLCDDCVKAIDNLPAEPNWKQRWDELRVKVKKIYGNTHFTEALHVLEAVQKEMKKLEEEP